MKSFRSRIKRCLPWPIIYLYRKIYYFPKDFPAAVSFLFHKTATPTPFIGRLNFILSCYWISLRVDCPHTENEIITIARRILNLNRKIEGLIVEAGAYKGGSTAKLSLVASLADRKLAVFDSFEGMPENNEEHGRSIFGREHHFGKGSHTALLEETKGNVARYGDLGRCRFYKGWFEETMPDLKEPVSVACINADLVQSTKTCLKYLLPLLTKGGFIFSQDGHFPWIINLLRDNSFWEKEIGIKKPKMEGLGFSKLVAIVP